MDTQNFVPFLPLNVNYRNLVDLQANNVINYTMLVLSQSLKKPGQGFLDGEMKPM